MSFQAESRERSKSFLKSMDVRKWFYTAVPKGTAVSLKKVLGYKYVSLWDKFKNEVYKLNKRPFRDEIWIIKLENKG
jgi:hypothetical protein